MSTHRGMMSMIIAMAAVAGALPEGPGRERADVKPLTGRSDDPEIAAKKVAAADARRAAKNARRAQRTHKP